MRSLIVILLFSYLSVLYAQQPYYYRLNHENGLPSNEVYTSVQDSFGYVWIGCDAGLVRYDGFRFNLIPQPKGLRNSISNLHLHKGKEIWCQNFSGDLFQIPTMENELNQGFDAKKFSQNFPDFTIDQDGNCWVLTDTILFREEKSGSFSHFATTSSLGLSSGTFSSIAKHQNQKIAVIGYEGALRLIDTRTHKIKIYQLPCRSDFRFQLFETEKGVVIMTEYQENSKRLYNFHCLQNGELKVLDEGVSFNGGQLLSISYINNQLFYCSDRGVYFRDDAFSQWSVIFEGIKISSISKMREGETWFTSLQDGIFVVPNMNFLHLKSESTEHWDHNITCLAQNKNDELIFGNYSGELYRSDSKLLVKSKMDLESKPFRAVKKVVVANDLMYVARGEFDIFKNGVWLESLKELTNTRDFVLYGDTIFYTRSSQTGYLVKSGRAWQNTVIRNKGGHKVAKKGNELLVLFADGLYSFQNGFYKELKIGIQTINGTTLFQKNEQIFVGTTNRGVLEYRNGKLVPLDKLNKLLPDFEVLDIYVNEELILIATRKGLLKLSQDYKDIKIISEKDGLAVKEIQDMIIMNDVVFLATIDGLIRFSLDKFRKNSIQPSIKIDCIKRDGITIEDRDLMDLSYGNQRLVFQFSSVALRSRGDYKIKYRLKGFSDAWIYIPASQGEISFNSLPSGAFELEIIAVNEDGVQSDILSLPIVVKSPIWQKWWFYLLVTFVMLGLMYFLFRQRIKSIRSKALNKNKMLHAQLTAIKSQMNPHFMFNTLNSLQDLILKQDFKSTNYYLSKYSALMRMILTNSEKREVELSDEIKMLGLYLELEKLRFGDEFKYEINVHELDDNSYCLPPMVIQPFIENAVKHGLLHKQGEKLLVIDFNIQDELLICSVKDNGIGRKRAGEIQERQATRHMSFSTEANAERLRLLQDYYGKSYDFEIRDLQTNGNASGTEVIIRFSMI